MSSSRSRKMVPFDSATFSSGWHRRHERSSSVARACLTTLRRPPIVFLAAIVGRLHRGGGDPARRAILGREVSGVCELQGRYPALDIVRFDRAIWSEGNQRGNRRSGNI